MTELLKTFTTMKIGGSPEKLLRLKDLSELKSALPQPVRILGNGSNILIDDKGLKGTVIVVRDFPPAEPEILETQKDFVRIRASAGIFLPTLCRWTEKRGWSGCEYMIGVPGTLGGAVAQNAGANEQEIAMIFEEAEVFDLATSKTFKLSHEEAKFEYRHSTFKDHPQWMVISVVLRLKTSSARDLTAQIQKNLDYRRQNTPFQRPSLGSVFTRIKAQDGTWLYPGKLIQDAGLKGERIGGAQISPVHANYITNEANATLDDVVALIQKIESEVKSKFGVTMQREILIWSDR